MYGELILSLRKLTNTQALLTSFDTEPALKALCERWDNIWQGQEPHLGKTTRNPEDLATR